MLAWKNLLNYTTSGFPNDCKNNNKIIYTYFNDKYVKSFYIKKIHETRVYILEQINHNDLMSEKYKKTCK